MAEAPGPTPRVAAARVALRALGLPAGARVIVACSGGPDSLALAATAAHVGPRAGWLCRAVVVDHALRAGSAAEAAAVADTCRALGLEAEVRRVSVPGGGTGAGHGGPEAAARTVRYQALEAAARSFGGGAGDVVVLLGHTMDDQAETVLLGLARGSGARSLAGMAPAAGRYRRPFLTLRRTDTEGICADLGLRYLRDPSNELNGPWLRADGGPLRRTALRHTVIPALVEALGPGVVPALARTADLLRRDADRLDAEGAALRRRARVDAPTADALVLALAPLQAAHPAVRTRALHQAIIGLQHGHGSLTARHVEAADRLVVDYHGQGPAHLPGHIRAGREGDTLVLKRQKE